VVVQSQRQQQVRVAHPPGQVRAEVEQLEHQVAGVAQPAVASAVVAVVAARER
jgi:hypothetical protein